MQLDKKTRELVVRFVHECHDEDYSGHDFFHVERVVKNARVLAEKEEGDPLLTELAAWLHDTADPKVTDVPLEMKRRRRNILSHAGVSSVIIEEVEAIIAVVSYSSGKKAVTVEQKIVQDADRLEAIGAVGVMRAFHFGASRHQEFSLTLQHFEDKLLRIKDLIWTATARKEAEDRHSYIKRFMEKLEEEMAWGDTNE